MHLLHGLIEGPVVYRFGWMLLHFLWQGAGVALATLLVLRAMRNARPERRYAVSVVALLFMAVLPVATLALMGLHFLMIRRNGIAEPL